MEAVGGVICSSIVARATPVEPARGDDLDGGQDFLSLPFLTAHMPRMVAWSAAALIHDDCVRDQ
jgi:hypothetical protein